MKIWTDQQVANVRAHQESLRFHPYTCGGGGGPCSGVIMTVDNYGLHCPTCNRKQVWVHDFVLDGSWMEQMRAHHGA